jgi:signal transduction histidine kinase/ActR/RegA family two-component response regulator
MLRQLFQFDQSHLHAFEREIAARSNRLGAAYASLASLAYAVVYWLIGPPEFVPVNVVGGLLLAAIALRPPANPGLGIFLVVNLALVVLAYQMVLIGGLMHAAVAWLVVPSVTVLMIGMRALGIYLALINIALVLLVVIGKHLGWIEPRVSLVHGELQLAISLIAAQGLVLLIGLLILRARDLLIVEIGERTRQLAEALEHARAARAEAEAARNETIAASRAKEEFFANLTHEIRTPLAGVVGAVSLLRPGELPESQRRLVDGITSSAAELAEVVDAMLDHAKLSAGRFSTDLAPLRLAELLESLSSLMADRAQRRGLHLSLEIEPGTPERLVVDRMWLRRILVNLLANAIKFTGSGSVLLRLRLGRPDEPALPGSAMALVAEVTDTGIGIPADKLEAVFQPFVQADASITRRFGGTGLGLAISRRLAELMGGTLGATSVEGRGSRFVLRLPVALPGEAAGEHPTPAVTLTQRADGPAAAAGATRPAQRVLLVEDNPVNRMVAGEMLSMLDCEVVLAENGREALALLAQAPVDLILMDLQMPVMDGISATRALRAREVAQGLPRTRVIALSGNSAADYGDACTEAGMDGFLVKPVSLESLQSVLRPPPASDIGA